jgi:hypothetical protein
LWFRVWDRVKLSCTCEEEETCEEEDTCGLGFGIELSCPALYAKKFSLLKKGATVSKEAY